MNQARMELDQFYRQRATKEHEREVFDRGFYQGMLHERQVRADAYALGVMHCAVAWLVLMVAVQIVRAL